MARFLLDITRFISRFGRGHPTGIDRVEIEYIREIAHRDGNSFALARLGQGFVVVPITAVISALDRLERGEPVGRWGAQDGFRLKLPQAERKARQFFRASAIHAGRDLTKVLQGLDLRSMEYVNVGHSNLSPQVFTALRASGVARITVMVHDMIPLDFPQFTRAGIPEQFARRMQAVAQFADRIICNSAHTEARVKHYFNGWGATAETLVAHLGVAPLFPQDRGAVDPLSFVVIGTIEPRKNHQILFQAWEQLAQSLPAERMPRLHVVGKRGWDNAPVFAYLDKAATGNGPIIEHDNMSDKQLAQLIANSAALLFPSHAEGYGLPALEAAQLGVPVICSDIPVFREILGGAATYLPAGDATRWAETLRSVANRTTDLPIRGEITDLPQGIPTWRSHFRHVFGDTLQG
ncbi:glycosyltransferase family 4 protein [Neptunicoccus sediminis]|uniref:glycosyltransferase family 4 protein n=1 Tax=Neptunicoccus sediminis TaxID=1892596 RepID=UPI00084607C3|nr:glycosyltransferase family 1 protein [Neptunicoccus sediminis]